MNGVGMMWAVNQQGVKEFKIEYSYDGEFFDVLTTVPAHGSAQYRFTHRETMPGFVHYRIKAVMADGTDSDSQVQTVRIVSRK